MYRLKILSAVIAILIIFLYSCPLAAQESSDGENRVDMPEPGAGKYTIPDDNGSDTEPPIDPIPPIEPWGVPIETDEVVFVIDRTGSMKYPFTGTVFDLEGNQIFGATKMEATNIELKRTIMNLSENIKFNISYYAHRYGTAPQGHPVHTPPPGPEPANHYDPPGSEPDVVSWQSELVYATVENKASAFAWIDARGTPNGCTCISDGTVDGGLAFDTKTVVLLTDGWPNTFRRVIYYSDMGYDVDYVFNRTKSEIKAANTQGATIHCFYIPYGNSSMDAKARQLMQEIAAMNGPGSFTQIGG
ncbi:MAG: vWA domain-containing protein [Planctomycetota bacterium]|jgi:hypothetical protein